MRAILLQTSKVYLPIPVSFERRGIAFITILSRSKIYSHPAKTNIFRDPKFQKKTIPVAMILAVIAGIPSRPTKNHMSNIFKSKPTPLTIYTINASL